MFRKRSQTSGAAITDLRDLSLRSLQVFAAVAEAGSLTAAAERLGGTRSAVSQQVTNLERVVGAVLLDRTCRPVALTPLGQTLLQHAYKILHAVGEARAALLEPRLGSWIEIRLGWWLVCEPAIHAARLRSLPAAQTFFATHSCSDKWTWWSLATCRRRFRQHLVVTRTCPFFASRS